MTLQGIDVSHAGQGSGFPWGSYHGKIQFAFTKISEGVTFADPDARANLASMRSLGLVAGGYHFLRADVSGEAQAEAFLSHAHSAGLRPGDIIWVDMEDGGLRGMPYARMNAVGADFRAQLRKHTAYASYNPVLYTEISMAPQLPGMAACPLHLANPSGAVIKSVGPWHGGPSFEQVSQRGVDCDVFYGDLAQLKKLAIPG